MSNPVLYFGVDHTVAVCPHAIINNNVAIQVNPQSKIATGIINYNIFLSCLDGCNHGPVTIKLYSGPVSPLICDPARPANCWFVNKCTQLVAQWNFNAVGVILDPPPPDCPVENPAWTSGWQVWDAGDSLVSGQNYALIAVLHCDNPQLDGTQKTLASDPCLAVVASLAF